ncbi:hypothetical protein [Halosolutus gelatinilyticus]|nr:hypothetical protein [Halosolutus gelatinilyticus]
MIIPPIGPFRLAVLALLVAAVALLLYRSGVLRAAIAVGVTWLV